MAASSDTLHASRLATGDWVVLRRPDDGPLGFLGKVTDGEWDPRDDALLRARVDTTRSKPVWFAAGDLERVSPSDEAALVEAALGRGLVPTDRAARLRADVDALRDRRLTFVRSPGLLDRLWAALPADPEQRSGGLAAFFDEGQRALLEARHERDAPDLTGMEQPPAVAPPPAEAVAPPPPLVVAGWPPEPRPRLRPTTEAEAVRRLLDELPRWSLRGLCLRLGRADLEDQPAVAVRSALAASDLRLAELLARFSPGLIREVPPLLGLPRAEGRSEAAIVEWTLDQLAGLPRGTPSSPVPEPLPPLPPWSPPPPPTSEQELRWRVLTLVRARDLEGVCERIGNPYLLRGTVADSCLTIASSTVRLGRLLFALPLGALRHAPALLGLPSSGQRLSEELVAQIVAAAPPPDGRVARSCGVLSVQRALVRHAVGALGLAEQAQLLLAVGPGRRGAAPDDAGLALLDAGFGIRDVLSHLGPGALRRVATACGVPDAIEAPEALHAAILSLEPSPFA